MGNGTRLTDLERGAWIGFLWAHHVLVGELDDELRRAHDLPLTSFDVLVQLDLSDEGQLRMSELADAVLLSRSGLTRLVERLESKGLLERRGGPEGAPGADAGLPHPGRTPPSKGRGTPILGGPRRLLPRFHRGGGEGPAPPWGG